MEGCTASGVGVEKESHQGGLQADAVLEEHTGILTQNSAILSPRKGLSTIEKEINPRPLQTFITEEVWNAAALPSRCLTKQNQPSGVNILRQMESPLQTSLIENSLHFLVF